MLRIIRKLERPRAGETRYCNCDKHGYSPCQLRPVVLAQTEDGELQLCHDCAKEYAE
jgi:hypothetical protein